MEGYSEATLHRVGQRKTEIMISTLQMIKPGYFLLTVPHNSKSRNQNMRYAIITIDYVYLEVGMIQGYNQMVKMAGQIQVTVTVVMNYQQEWQEEIKLDRIWQGLATSK